ncbi:MAG: SIS domain-containing protein, partial [Campylobacteraceae bacterium]|nr:SIS domain-containing protein [Campylobacteraceae bacterium]
ILNIQNLTLNINNNKEAHAVSLCENITKITEIANNFGIDRIFDKQIELRVKPEDVLIGFSTSGNSKNVLRALSLGRNLGCKTIGFSSGDGGAMDEFCDLNLVVPSDDADIIQEIHLVIGNIIFRT